MGDMEKKETRAKERSEEMDVSLPVQELLKGQHLALLFPVASTKDNRFDILEAVGLKKKQKNNLHVNYTICLRSAPMTSKYHLNDIQKPYS